MAHGGRGLSLTAIGDGETLITGGRDGMVRVWRPDLNAARWQVPVKHTTEIAMGLENWLYRCDSQIEVWNLNQREPIDSFAPTDSPWTRIACSRNGHFLAAVRPGQLVLFDRSHPRNEREN